MGSRIFIIVCGQCETDLNSHHTRDFLPYDSYDSYGMIQARWLSTTSGTVFMSLPRVPGCTEPPRMVPDKIFLGSRITRSRAGQLRPGTVRFWSRDLWYNLWVILLLGWSNIMRIRILVRKKAF